MKSFTLFTVLFCLLNTGNAQQSPTEAKPEFARFKIGLTVTPDMGYRILTINSDMPTFYKSYLKHRNENETPKLGYSAGLTVNYNFSKRIGVETGLQYASRGYIYKVDDIKPVELIQLPEKVKIISNWNYLEIPLRFVFTSGDKKMKFLASAGVTMGFFLNGKRTFFEKYADGSEIENYNKLTITNRQIAFSPQLSFGAEYQLRPLIHFRFEPIARYALNCVEYSPIHTNLISGGLLVSFYVVL